MICVIKVNLVFDSVMMTRSSNLMSPTNRQFWNRKNFSLFSLFFFSFFLLFWGGVGGGSINILREAYVVCRWGWKAEGWY